MSSISAPASPHHEEENSQNIQEELGDNSIIPTPDSNIIIPRRSKRLTPALSIMTQPFIASYPFLHTRGGPSTSTHISGGDVPKTPVTPSIHITPEEYRPEPVEKAEILKNPLSKEEDKESVSSSDYDPIEQISRLIYHLTTQGCPMPFNANGMLHPTDMKVVYVCSSEEISLRIMIQN